MTNKEAIEEIRELIEIDLHPCPPIYEEALNLAIKALERPQGKWLDIYKSHIAYECSCCGRQMPIADYYKFCPNCGADMRVKDELNNELNNELNEAYNLNPCSSCVHFNNGNLKSYPCGSCFINSHNMWEPKHEKD